MVHMSQHFKKQCDIMNARWCQNYLEESGIGSTAAVWRHSVVGKYRASIQRFALLKKVVALAVRFEGILDN